MLEALTFKLAGGHTSFEHGVQLSRSPALGLRKVQVREGDTSSHPTGEDEVGLWAKVTSARNRFVSRGIQEIEQTARRRRSKGAVELTHQAEICTAARK